MECAFPERQACSENELPTGAGGDCDGLTRRNPTMHLPETAHLQNQRGGAAEESESMEAEGLGSHGTEHPRMAAFFSKELIQFSLFGKIHPKSKRPGNDLLSLRIAEIQGLYRNIPDMLSFSPSSVSFNGIGIYATNHLPKETVLGPYVGQEVHAEAVELNRHNAALWEIYQDSALACFVDASNPKFGNWMNFIQCARSQTEQNLKVMQVENHLYFEAIRDVMMGEELLVWYDDSQYELHMGVPIAYKGGGKKGADHQRTTGMSNSSSNSSSSSSNSSSSNSGSSGSVTHHAPATKTSSSSATLSYNTFAFSNIAHNYATSNSNMETSSSVNAEDNIITSNAAEPEHINDGAGVGGGEGGRGGGRLSSERTTPLLSQQQNMHSRGSDSTLESGFVNQHNGFPPQASSDLDGTSSHHLQMYPSNESLQNDGGFSVMMDEKQQQTKLRNKHPMENGSLNNIKEASLVGPLTNGIISGQQHHSPSVDQGQGQHSETWPSTSGVVLMQQPQQQQQQQPHANGPISQQNKKQPPSLLYGMFSRCEDGSRWQCEECKRLFSSQGSLRAHSRIHTGERPYRCQYCFRTFCQASTLRSHERLHTGEKPYKCKHCGRAFTQSAGLRSHLKTHRYDAL